MHEAESFCTILVDTDIQDIQDIQDPYHIKVGGMSSEPKTFVHSHSNG